MRQWLIRGRLVAILATIATLAPVEWSDHELRVSEASCSDGTCCFEEKSDCIINNILISNAYAKLGGGSCTVLKPNPGG